MAARKFLSEGDDETKLDLTPMIDAVFQLLIFFMVTSVFIKATVLKVELPEATHNVKLSQQKELNLIVAGDGKFEVNGQIISLQELAGVLDRAKNTSGATTLIITADGKTPHGFVIDAMEVAVQIGVEKIDIETLDSAKRKTGSS